MQVGEGNVIRLSAISLPMNPTGTVPPWGYPLNMNVKASAATPRDLPFSLHVPMLYCCVVAYRRYGRSLSEGSSLNRTEKGARLCCCWCHLCVAFHRQRATSVCTKAQLRYDLAKSSINWVRCASRLLYIFWE